MSFNCIICSDLLSATDEIYGTRCGHAFHYTCLLNWVERSKTCPQCRTKTTEKTIFRIYFNFVSSEGITLDVGALQNKLDNAEFSLKEKGREISDLKQEIDKLKSKNEIYKSESKESRNKLDSKEIAIKMLKEQVAYLKEQNDEIVNLKEDNHKLKKSLDSCKGLNEILNATADDIKSILDQHLDVNTLCTWVTVLQKQVMDSESKKKVLRETVRKLQNKLTDEHGKSDSMKNRIRDMEEKIEDLEGRMKEKEAALEEYKNKPLKENVSDIIFETPEATTSKNNIHKRKRDDLIENIYPSSSEKSDNDKDLVSNNKDSPYFNLRQGNAVMAQFKMKKKLITSPMKLTIFNMDKLSKPSTNMFKGKSSKSDHDLSYDGLGGHSKPDIFPTAQHNKISILQQKKTKSVFKRVQRPPDQRTLDSIFKK